MQHPLLPLPPLEKLHLQSQLLDEVRQAILVIDLAGRIVFWNRFAETLYGRSWEDVQDRDISEVLASPLMVESLQASLAQLQPGEVWSGDYSVKRQDGISFITHISASFILSEQSKLIRIVGISYDSAEHRQLQEANRLLAEAGALLINAVDFETPLTTLAQLAVPQLADWCAVHLLQSDGSIEQVALAPADMAKVKAAYDWLQNHLPLDEADGLPAVIRSGEPKLVTNLATNPWAVAAAIKSYMIVPLITPPKTLGTITFVTVESGRSFDLNALALAENLVSHISIYLDKARLYSDSQRLNAELEQRVSDRTFELRSSVSQLRQSESTIQTLFRISKKLNSTLDVGTILDELAQEAIRIVDGESGFAGLCTVDGMTVRKIFQNGAARPYRHAWAWGEGIPGWVLKYKIPYGTSDAENDPVMQHDLPINANVRSTICTPILDSVGEVLGYFDIRNKRGYEGFTIEDQEMLMALAPAASIAIQNAQAYQQRLATVAELKESASQLQALAANLELAREEERTQIARELHDQLGQALTSMKFDLAWLTGQLVTKDELLSEKARTVTAQMDTMIKTVRRIATELRPGMLDDLGLAASFEWQARDFEKRTGIVCAVSVPPVDVPAARAQSVALFRIFQEALTNVARHAGAQHVEVTLSATPEALSLTIHDDGRGIMANEITGLHSLGLMGMRERAKRLGGVFDIQGLPDDGTLILVTIPLDGADGRH